MLFCGTSFDSREKRRSLLREEGERDLGEAVVAFAKRAHLE